ncbi:endonuclease domain-containing protein [Arthrobacter sp. zg-Y769]|uniref:endonuclease domain-containing protein n=1 Tax=Arthrobacter sp. zg-Y769 TaxID=2894191 RepID=UPI001E2ECCFE|nr:endonuclease domain-containing protein [Arthrobacter sp. zg-Y769]MCC9205471.1 endonuclease domain-containing protein [Arthrobacter sp. zg-Y769]
MRVPKTTTFDLAAGCRPYLELLPDAVISHGTAARLHGLALPRRVAEEPLLHLSRSPACGPPRRRHICGHRLLLASNEVTQVYGLPVTTVARTWLDLAGMLSVEELVIMGDQIVSEHQRTFGTPRRPLVPLEELRDLVKHRSGVPKVRRSREALEYVRVGVDSPPETRLRLMLAKQADLPEFIPNVALLDEYGQPQVWADLGCPEFRTCLEYDGAHHLTPEQQARDHYRDLRTAELGWNQVKISRTDLTQGSSWVAAKVRRGLTMGGWTPSG